MGITGCIGCILTGLFLSKRPSFKVLAIGTAFCHFICYLSFVVTLEFYQSKWLTGI